jgi:inner membrane protein involved in colicin E2 resistance
MHTEETTQSNPSWNNKQFSKSSNKTVMKLIIVAVLTLVMIIPTTLISNMVIERQTTYKQQVHDAKDTASFSQTIKSINYEKTMRTTKYAILVIGLTFGIFFLIEVLQKKPVHPVQYTLVGLALVIFYTLVLSIAEYILFNYAYIIAAIATILLITLYVKSHFKNWKAASALGSTLTALYAFILVLISLEDVALLVGSVGLFIVLAVVMYATRNINWYGDANNELATVEG